MNEEITLKLRKAIEGRARRYWVVVGWVEMEESLRNLVHPLKANILNPLIGGLYRCFFLFQGGYFQVIDIRGCRIFLSYRSVVVVSDFGV